MNYEANYTAFCSQLSKLSDDASYFPMICTETKIIPICVSHYFPIGLQDQIIFGLYLSAWILFRLNPLINLLLQCFLDVSGILNLHKNVFFHENHFFIILWHSATANINFNYFLKIKSPSYLILVTFLSSSQSKNSDYVCKKR